MASESRVITFTDAEILQAVAAFCVTTGRLALNTKLMSPVVTNEGEIRLSFDLDPTGDLDFRD